ncbi:hypothetical protein DOTSEDRAFT_29723 [Lecanosticta acicola]|uniref:RING-type domain-containing protein n=1 Tax=Lecanosticta acicola TaxID=111012 RepID=A0AAI8Z575_9PEZI|nr:hypothetical protein DOTSEDRAFT_29723 [Lecanosticta acicola]
MQTTAASSQALLVTYVPEFIATDVLKVLEPFDTFISNFATLSSDSQDSDCPICYNPLDPADGHSILIGGQSAADRLIVTPHVCPHSYHVGCLELNFKMSRDCPYCRRTLVPQPTYPVFYDLIRDIRMGLYDSSLHITERPLKVASDNLTAAIVLAAFACFTLRGEQEVWMVRNSSYPFVVAGTEAGRAMVAQLLEAARKLDGRRRTIEYLREYLLGEAVYETSLSRSVTPDMECFAAVVSKFSVHVFATIAAQEQGLMDQD